jgi:hypothetical protein
MEGDDDFADVGEKELGVLGDHFASGIGIKTSQNHPPRHFSYGL